MPRRAIAVLSSSGVAGIFCSFFGFWERKVLEARLKVTSSGFVLSISSSSEIISDNFSALNSPSPILSSSVSKYDLPGAVSSVSLWKAFSKTERRPRISSLERVGGPLPAAARCGPLVPAGAR